MKEIAIHRCHFHHYAINIDLNSSPVYIRYQPLEGVGTVMYHGKLGVPLFLLENLLLEVLYNSNWTGN